MIKLENTILPSADQWKAIIFGARNPLNSWARSDSKFDEEADFDPEDYPCGFELGDNDYSLMQRLAKAGTDHRKFMRMITVYIDITAPLYWWKEFDTYKIGTVANSCSTMHKIAEKEFTLEDFSHEHLLPTAKKNLESTIDILNGYRDQYNVDTNSEVKKAYWWQMIQLLPSSYNQKRTVMLNYEVLANMYKSRKNHKLDEWHDLCAWIESIPCSELITGEAKTE
jgi:hypothetical protein